MSILIKNMEMPKNCTECRFACDGWCYAMSPTEPNSKSLATKTRPSWCPLIELPPHGRLIDADALMLKINDYIEEYSPTDEHGMHNLKWCAMKETEMAINDAPTIIEAEEEE